MNERDYYFNLEEFYREGRADRLLVKPVLGLVGLAFLALAFHDEISKFLYKGPITPCGNGYAFRRTIDNPTIHYDDDGDGRLDRSSTTLPCRFIGWVGGIPTEEDQREYSELFAKLR